MFLHRGSTFPNLINEINDTVKEVGKRSIALPPTPLAEGVKKRQHIWET